MNHNIYVHKGIAEGRTPLSPQSPTTSSTTNTPPSSKPLVSKAAALVVAKSVVNTVVQDMRESGNEELASTISNTMTLAGIGLLAIKAPPALLLVGANGVIQEVTQHRARVRENRNRDFDREQMGQRLTHAQRGAYLE